MNLDDALSQLLARYMPHILAQSVRRRAITAIGATDATLRPDQLPALRRELESGIRLFVDASAQHAVMREIDALCAGHAPKIERERVVLRVEADVVQARGRAREVVAALGGGSFVVQRAATVASELARNVVAYAGEGHLELRPQPERGLLTIVAVDRGPGIVDLDAILEGRYRSRTGLGMGLRGVKRLAARFEVQTGPAGTTIEVDIVV